jgi:hypothetical protein
MICNRQATVRQCAALALVITSSSVGAQQIVDSTFTPTLRAPAAFSHERGPIVLVDEAHDNFHTVSGRYRPFVRLLEADGFVVRASSARFDSASLASARVLVIANAVAERNKAQTDWRLPAYSAFAPAEIAALAAWIRRGGSLLLIADHLPFAGAADSLASAIGVFFANGFALQPNGPDPRTGDYPIVFRRDGGLVRHPIVDGRSRVERVDSVVSFTGSAFRLGATVQKPRELMRLPPGTRVRLPVVAWQFSDSTPEIRGDDMLQGATFRLGRGRVAVFGEAAMFSAQIKGPQRTPMGMNAPEAAQNPQFVLNVLHWLAGLIADR